MKRLGIISLGEAITVTDPSYSPDIWCCKHLNILPGRYVCEIETVKDEVWGLRPSILRITHEHYPAARPQKQAFHVGVDSGQAGFFDEAYFRKQKEENDKEWYDKICDITLRTESPYGVIDNSGAVSESGYGDGVYDCLTAENKNGNIVAAELVFICEESEDN